MFRVKKILIICLSIVSLMCMTAFSINAAEDPDPIKSLLKSCLSSEDFDEKWEKSATAYVGSTYVGKMVYGYDTYLINEDYANTLGSGKRSRAALWRSGYDENPTQASIKNSGVWSTCDLTHKVYYVYYYGNFYN